MRKKERKNRKQRKGRRKAKEKKQKFYEEKMQFEMKKKMAIFNVTKERIERNYSIFERNKNEKL